MVTSIWGHLPFIDNSFWLNPPPVRTQVLNMTGRLTMLILITMQRRLHLRHIIGNSSYPFHPKTITVQITDQIRKQKLKPRLWQLGSYATIARFTPSWMIKCWDNFKYDQSINVICNKQALYKIEMRNNTFNFRRPHKETKTKTCCMRVHCSG